MAIEARSLKDIHDGILASPEDDGLRREFATILETGPNATEADKSRARYIRLQLRLASMWPDHPEWMRLATEALSLGLRYQNDWIPELYRDDGVRDVEFHRGFLEQMTVRAETFFGNREEFFLEAPLQHLDIVELSEDFTLRMLFNARFQANRAFRNIRSLRLDGQGISDADVSFLASLPWVNLRWFSLAHNEIGGVGVQALLDSSLSQLEFVDLHNNPVDPVEQLIYDQDAVVETVPTSWMKDFPDVRWLRREVVGGQVVYPRRFEVGSERAEPEAQAEVVFA